MAAVALPQRADYPTPVDEDVEPWTIEEVETRTRGIGRRLMQINKEQVHNNDEWINAKAAYRKPLQKRIVEIHAANPDLPKWACEARAETELANESALDFAWERIVRSNNDDAKNLRALLSSMQTIYNRLCNQAGHYGGSRG